MPGRPSAVFERAGRWERVAPRGRSSPLEVIVVEHSPRFVQLVEDARTRVRECTCEEVHRRLETGGRFHLVDVREDHEWRKSRIKGATHLARGILERDIEHIFPDLDEDLVLYCGGGYRSALGAESLEKMGYRRVASMAGGWRRWKELGFPLEY